MLQLAVLQDGVLVLLLPPVPITDCREASVSPPSVSVLPFASARIAQSFLWVYRLQTCNDSLVCLACS